MGAEEILKKLPASGFLKVGGENATPLPKEKRAALIRKGNELFNKGRYDLAKRIFLTTRYTDGLIRLGDMYYKRKKPLHALQAYWLAPSPAKAEALIERMAGVLSKWLMEEKDSTRT
jgi:hypothetical protein